MQFIHKVDKRWLRARKAYMTASSVAKCLPATPTGRVRDTNKPMLDLWAEMQQDDVTDDQCVSTGAAARGHLLEPFAIEAFNTVAGTGFPKMHHWDDALIGDDERMLAFSPDALSFEQPDDVTVDYYVDSQEIARHKDVYMTEVKCYSAGKHYLVGFSDKEDIEERWQIATAFSVMPSLVAAALVLFNPDVEHSMFNHVYTREELEDEIGMIDEVVRDYNLKVRQFQNAAVSRELCPEFDRDDIYRQIEEAVSLDPM